MTGFERYALFQLSHAYAPLLHRRYATAIFTGLTHQLRASLHQDNTTIWSIHSSIVMAGCQIFAYPSSQTPFRALGLSVASVFASSQPQLVLILIVEGIRYLFASIQRAYKHQQSSTSDYEAKGAGGCIAFIICMHIHSVCATQTGSAKAEREAQVVACGQ